MDYRFQKHYTLAEARALLPQVRQWLSRLNELRGYAAGLEEEIGRLMARHGEAGGPPIQSSVRLLVEFKKVLREFQTRQILIKDLDRGLVDFPAILAGKEVFLCWEQDEEDIEYWHDLEAGYAGRAPL